MTSELNSADRERIIQAIETIGSGIDRLVEIRDSTTRQEYHSSPDKQDIVERRFVKITGAAIDIGRVLLDDRDSAAIGSPTTMRSLSDQDILEEELASKMVAAARFRNVLAHVYGETIDHDVVYDALVDLERYRAFVHAIHDHLEREGVFEDA